MPKPETTLTVAVHVESDFELIRRILMEGYMPLPATRRTTISPRPVPKSAPRKVAPRAPDTKYLRDKYPEDEVVQAYADVIERNLGLWEAIKSLERARIDLAGCELVSWEISTRAEPRDLVRTAISIKLINKEATKRVRP